MDIGPTLFRGVAGPLFIGHGSQKLWGKFGGHGIEGTGGAFEQLGLRPGERHAKAAGIAEVTGGTLLTLGALTPLAATLVSSTMVTAIRKVHWKQGPWNTEGGWEFPAMIIAAMAALADRGPGSPSVDATLFPRLHGRTWAIGSLLAATAGSTLVTSPPLNQGDAGAPEQAPVPSDPASGDDDRFERGAAADTGAASQSSGQGVGQSD